MQTVKSVKEKDQILLTLCITTVVYGGVQFVSNLHKEQYLWVTWNTLNNEKQILTIQNTEIQCINLNSCQPLPPKWRLTFPFYPSPIYLKKKKTLLNSFWNKCAHEHLVCTWFFLVISFLHKKKKGRSLVRLFLLSMCVYICYLGVYLERKTTRAPILRHTI